MTRHVLRARHREALSSEGRKRREFIRYGACGLGAIVLGGCGGGGSYDLPRATLEDGVATLTITDALVEMVDGRPIYHWVFAGPAGPMFPGPVLFTSAGSQLTFDVRNTLDEVHGFRIVGAGPDGSDIDSDPIPPGESATISFQVPAAGVYPYWDPRNAPFNRIMGLHGVLVVLPEGVEEGTAVNTPYTNPTPNVQALFDALGREEPFTPGADPWIPIRPAHEPANPELPPEIEPFLYRTRYWIFAQVDPRWNDRILAGANAEPGGSIDVADFVRSFVPEYFLLNGQSGQFSSHAKATALEGFIGEPHLVRIVNTGVQVLSLHLHANHPYVTAVNNHVMEDVRAIDSMSVPSHEGDAKDFTFGGGVTADAGLFLSGGSRVDWLVPFIRPPDIPQDPERRFHLRDVILNEFRFVLGGVQQSPFKYPMHDHMEPSQTAAGGNYPNGSMTDFIFLGDWDKVPFPRP
jgi:hypothetical protein